MRSAPTASSSNARASASLSARRLLSRPGRAGVHPPREPPARTRTVGDGAAGGHLRGDVLWIASGDPPARTPADGLGTVPSAIIDDAAPWLTNSPNRFRPPVTALFIHADWLHLTTNLLFLVIFGVPAERAPGSAASRCCSCSAALANLVGALTLAGTHAPIVGRAGRCGSASSGAVPRASASSCRSACSSSSCASRHRC